MASKKAPSKKKKPQVKKLVVRDLDAKVAPTGGAGCPILAALVKDMGY